MLSHGGEPGSMLGRMWLAPAKFAIVTKVGVHQLRLGWNYFVSHAHLAMMASISLITISIAMMSGENMCLSSAILVLPRFLT